MSNIIVSVVVCTYNREKYILDNLKHLDNQSSKKELYEIIIINNNSTDSTEKICLDFISKYKNLDVKYFNETNQGHSFARNRGIQEASGEILAFIDDDAFVDHDYIKNIIYYFQKNPGTSAIGGKIIPIYERVEPDWMSTFLLPLVSALDMGNINKPFKRHKFPIGANMAYRRGVFGKYGMFNVLVGRRGSELEGGDEKELIIRLKKGNENIYYVANVLVKHIIPEKRLQMEYIKGLAKGVAKSEKTRLRNASRLEKLSKVFNELVKIGGTFVLSMGYLLSSKIAKSKMLVKFRWWVLTGYMD